MGAHGVSLGRVWSTACTLIVPGSHEGLFYRVYVMTGEYTEPCLIRNPSEARIMLSYLHDCQGSVKNTVRGMQRSDIMLLGFRVLSTAAV